MASFRGIGFNIYIYSKKHLHLEVAHISPVDNNALKAKEMWCISYLVVEPAVGVCNVLAVPESLRILFATTRSGLPVSWPKANEAL
jgi:hypothetical protein